MHYSLIQVQNCILKVFKPIIFFCIINSNYSISKAELTWMSNPNVALKVDFNVRKNPFLKLSKSKNQVFFVTKPTPESCKHKIFNIKHR